MRPSHRSARTALLLLLTYACAQKFEHPVATPSASEIDAFRALGVDAPQTSDVDDRERGPLDLDQIAVAFAEPKAVTPEEADRRQTNDEGRDVASVEESGAVAGRPRSGDAFGEGEGGRSPSTGQVALPKKEPEAAKPAERSANLILETKPGFYDFKVEKDEKKGKEGDARRPTTVIARVERASNSARILVETEAGLKAIVPRAIRIVVHVQGARARTLIDYVFENPHDRRLEGTFFQPLPADASPAGFAMFDGAARIDSESFFKSARLLPALGEGSDLDLAAAAPSRSKGSIDWGKRKEARVVAHQRARQVYEDIVRKNVDPALLEAGGNGDFEARVFPLEPKSLKRVVIAYEQTLPYDGTSFRYGYVMPTDPSIVERAAELHADSSHGAITGPKGASTKQRGEWFDFSIPQARGGQEIALSVATPAQVVLRGRDPSGLPGEAFFATLRPDVPSAGDRATGRAILMIDTSLSSEENGAYRRRSALIRALLEKDTSIEQYAVMLFDVRPRWLHAIGWRDNTPENRAETYRELERVFLEGATNFAGALAELTKQRSWAIDGEPTTIFLLSDGHITWGFDNPDALPARHPIIRAARFVTYQFGEESNDRNLFDLLSRESKGQTVSLLSEAEIDKGALAHRNVPAELVSVEVEGARASDVAVAGDPRLLFPGQMLSIGGRLLESKAAKLVIRYRDDRGEHTIDAPLGDATRDDRFASRAFAELHARRLVALDDPRLDRMVVALSQHYRLANARASFLILDNDAQADEYELADEKLDLHDLVQLVEKEREQRKKDAIGLSLAEVPELGQQTIEMLRRKSDGLRPELLPQPLLDAPFAGGPDRAHREADYRAKRNEEKMSYLLYEGIARTRALSGDTFGAVRALSSAVEVRPTHGESMRLVGYALLALAQYDVATELFERLRILRPFEGEAFLEEALALDSAGMIDRAAENYEIILAREWARHDAELTMTARVHYARMLRSFARRASLSNAERAVVDSRIESLAASPADLSLTTHWSSDQVDIDLWVYEPSGEKCFYQQRTTSAGGELFWDTTDGLGPELYRTSKAAHGSYDSMVHYYGSSAPRLGVPAALLVVVDRTDAARTFLMRLLPERDVVLMLRTDVFE